MDVVDIAEKQDSLILQTSIEEVRRKACDEKLPITGYCHNCGEPCKGLFCDAECRDDYEHYMAALKRNGKIK
nr:MAG TPA: DNA-directed RNA polymerase subunit alpha [Caudoviricetes sp.]